MPIRTQTSRLLKPHTITGDERPHEMPVNAVIFSDGRRGIRNTERVLAADNNVTAWCDRKVEGTELQIWSAAGREKEPAIVPERKAARERNDLGRQDMLACAVELARKSPRQSHLRRGESCQSR